MGKCKRCNLTIADETDVCPLCQSVLEITDTAPSENKYPDIEFKIHKLRLASRMFLVLSLFLEAFLVWYNLAIMPGYLWSVIPGCFLIYINLVFHYILYRTRSNYGIDFLLGLIILIGILDIIDRFMGNLGWSMNYTQPLIILIANAIILFLMLINRRSWQSYLISQICLVLVSLLTIPLILHGDITKPKMTIVAIVITILCFLSTYILGGARAREELQRRFHIS